MARKWRWLHSVAILVLTASCAASSQAPPAAAGGQSSTAAYSPVQRAVSSGAAAAAGETLPPVTENSIRFAVLGDTGTGERAQYDVARQVWASHAVFPFEFVVLVGDNLYGSERPQDYTRKFELPYKPLLDAEIPFYAALGNHDDPNQVLYKPFNMNGDRYYTFKKDKLGSPGVRFYALDSTYMSPEQLEWLEKELATSDSEWKIAFFHHPIYSSGGRHGSELDLRQQIEPMFIKHHVDVVLAGHEHFYERLKPQRGIYYFTAGGAAKLREGDIRRTIMTAAGFDRDRSYLLIELTSDALHFQALSRTGERVDSGTLPRQPRPETQQ